MTVPLQCRSSTAGARCSPPLGFIAICAFAFFAGAWATVYFCHSMRGGMGMPGGWTMSMMWMRMNGHSWFSSAGDFQLMWLAMMAAMMMPSAVPMFLKTRRAPVSLSAMAVGYFTVWQAVGVGIYILGVLFATAVMRRNDLSRAVPLLSGVALIIAGIFQFTGWKLAALRRCRLPFGCSVSPRKYDGSFSHGFRQGTACCICCAAPMLMLIVLGMLNALAILGVGAVITAERLLPQSDNIARFVGTAAILAGILIIARKLLG